MEIVDDDLENMGIDFVKTSDEGIEEDYDECQHRLPCLMHFKYARHPTVFYGNLGDNQEISAWINDQTNRQ